ncbi:MAG: hypothetical protein ACI8QS_002075 [Planctomycetota bacterium]|jgi:hypothetical protein
MSSASREAHGADGSNLSLTPAWITELGWLLGRSLFPVVSLALIWGTVIWGPYVTLFLTLVWWRLVTRFA